MPLPDVPETSGLVVQHDPLRQQVTITLAGEDGPALRFPDGFWAIAVLGWSSVEKGDRVYINGAYTDSWKWAEDPDKRDHVLAGIRQQLEAKKAAA